MSIEGDDQQFNFKLFYHKCYQLGLHLICCLKPVILCSDLICNLNAIEAIHDLS